MKIRIIEPGWKNFTGFMAGVEFENGESSRELTNYEVDRISGAVRVESLEGEGVGAAVDLIKGKRVSADVQAPRERQTEDEKKAENADRTKKIADAKAKAEKAIEKAQAAGEAWSRESLESVADEKGIAGLREIGDMFGVKGRSIADLIDEIMKAQGKPAEVAKAPAEPETAEITVEE